jgi:thiamine-monophosphate kinase
MQRTEISDIGGEVGLINRIAQKFPIQQSQTYMGIGDDSAVLSASGQTLVSTELLLEGVHFDLAYTPLRHLGYKTVVVGIADIVAMNAIPRQVTMSMALSNRFSVEAIDEFYEGVKTACDQYNLDLVGGDTSASRSGLALSITAIGYAEADKIAYRNGAKPNDIVCVTGDLGGAVLGLQCLEREKEVFLANPEMQPELEGKDYVITRQLKPEARTDVVHELAEAGVVPTAMIDISDGLAAELLHLCRASGTGAVIFEDKIPIDDQSYLTATELNFSPMTAALNGGEDYELLFTIKQGDYEKIKHLSDIQTIGYMTDVPSEVLLRMKSERVVNLTAPNM